MTNWYDKVSKDVNNIPAAVAYYEAELLQAKKETNITGRIEKASSVMPALVETRFGRLQRSEEHTSELQSR